MADPATSIYDENGIERLSGTQTGAVVGLVIDNT